MGNDGEKTYTQYNPESPVTAALSAVGVTASNDVTMLDLVEHLEPTPKKRGKYICPVCGGDNLSIAKSGKFGCYSSDCSPKEIFKAAKQIAGLWVDRTDFDRDGYRKLIDRRAAETHKKRLAQQAQSPSYDQRHREISAELSRSPLTESHRQTLHGRGFDDAAIEHFGFWSTHQDKHGTGIAGAVRGLDGRYIGIAYRWDKSPHARYTFAARYSHIPQSDDLIIATHEPTGLIDDGVLYLSEGLIIKPQIAAMRLGGRVIGYGGGSNSIADRCKAQLLAAIEQFQPREIRILPDAGWAVNRGVRVALQSLVSLLSPVVPVVLGDWGQANDSEKVIGDIDDVSPDRLASIQWRPGAELLPADPIATFGAKPRTITRDEWIEKFGASELCEQLNRARRRSVGALNFLKSKRAESAAKHSPNAITPNNTQTAIELYDHTQREHPIAIGQPLPTPDEWIALGRPILVIDPSDNQADRWLELAALGYKAVLDSGETGRGKSHVAGELGQRVANGETEFGRLIYFSSGYRNPSTESIEAAAEMPTRHNGLVTDYLRRTATHQPFRVRPKKGQTPDIPGNCPKSDVFAAAAGRDVKLFGGKESPICQGCPLLGGCEFLRDRARTLNSEAFIRADLSQFATLKPTDIAIVDEASIEIQATKAIKVSKDEIAAELQAISVALVARDDITAIEAHHAQIIGKAIYDSIDAILTAKQAEHGLSHLEMIAALPNLNHLRALLPSRGQGWVSFRDIDGALVRRVKRTIDRILAPNLEIFGQSESPEVQLSRVRALHQDAIGKVLSVIIGDRSIDLGTHHGNLTITRRNQRPGRTIASAGFSILMDATANKRDLARKLGIDAGEIVELRAERSDYSNLTVQIIQGVGSCGRKRRDENTFDAGKRITYLLDHLKPEATIDYIDFADRYWFRDNRGSNEFKAMNHIAAVGLPTPNLGAAAAEWHALTGHAVNPTDRDGGYGAFVRRLIAAEILQLIGRPRSQWRPDEQITVTLIGDGFTQYQREIAEQFPGAAIEIVDVSDICPIAATKGEQTARAIVNNIVSFAREGKAITRQSIAAETGHSNPSKAIKDRFGVSLTELKRAVTFVLEVWNTKVTVDWSVIPEQLRALLKECFDVSDSLAAEDPDAAAQMILMAIEDARTEFGDSDTLAALAYFPIAHFEPLLKALGRVPIAAGAA